MKKTAVLFFFTLFTLMFTSCSNDPVACFKVIGVENGKVTFSSACSENVDEYEWDFGHIPVLGSSSSSKAHPTHQYPGPGVYTVSLTVKKEGQSDRTEETVTLNNYCVVCYCEDEDFEDKECDYFQSDAEARVEEKNNDASYDCDCQLEEQ